MGEACKFDILCELQSKMLYKSLTIHVNCLQNPTPGLLKLALTSNLQLQMRSRSDAAGGQVASPARVPIPICVHLTHCNHRPPHFHITRLGLINCNFLLNLFLSHRDPQGMTLFIAVPADRCSVARSKAPEIMCDDNALLELKRSDLRKSNNPDQREKDFHCICIPTVMVLRPSRDLSVEQLLRLVCAKLRVPCDHHTCLAAGCPKPLHHKNEVRRDRLLDFFLALTQCQTVALARLSLPGECSTFEGHPQS